MADITQTFSESWYRIANQRISLRTGINARRQNFRGQRWIVLENPFSNQFFRLRPAAYEFIARLRPDRTVEQAWRECLERFPDQAPGQEAAIQLLSQLYHANLLQYADASDSAQLFERYEKNQQKETRAKLLNVMFMRFPLLDPDVFLNKTIGLVGKLISPIGAIIWMLVVGWGLNVAFENWTQLKDHTQGVLAPQNLPLLYLSLILIKTLHEFGHAYFCKKFGGEVHVMGVLLMIFTPTPYMDATSSWAFRSRWKRLLVGAAGMITEVFFAAIALFIWANTKDPGIIHNLCYNVVFIASVSTVMFNLIPLLRFDGYYMLSDLLDIPNLAQRSMAHLRYLVERYAFGIKRTESPSTSSKEQWWFTIFGISSGIYRVFVFGRILLFVADRLLLIGIIMAAVCAISWVFVPTVKFLKYLASDPKLDRRRPRAVALTSALAALIVILLQFIPFPHHFRAPGVLEAQAWTQVVNEAPGYLEQILVTPGNRVSKDQALATFVNPELELSYTAAKASKAEYDARLLQAMKMETANLKPLRSKLESINKHILRIEADRAALTLRARQDGIWVAPQFEEGKGRWIGRGTALGLIIDPTAFEFVATVLQEDVDSLFAQEIKGAEVRLTGQADETVIATNLRKIPAEKRNLPSAALGWAGGGEVAVSKHDSQGQKAAEPFFEVHADLTKIPEVAFLHGRAGKIRFELQPEPLLPRAVRRLRQLLQKRYQL
jgi:putative peptide zinc metalloprotease protein